MGSIMSSFGMNMMGTNRDLIAETADRSTLPEGEKSDTRPYGKYPRRYAPVTLEAQINIP